MESKVYMLSQKLLDEIMHLDNIMEVDIYKAEVRLQLYKNENNEFKKEIQSFINENNESKKGFQSFLKEKDVLNLGSKKVEIIMM